MVENMTKRELVSRIALDTGLPFSSVQTVVDSCVENIVNFVSDGNSVQISGFGVFEPKLRAAKKSNLKAGSPVYIRERVLPNFRPSEIFKDKVDTEFSQKGRKI